MQSYQRNAQQSFVQRRQVGEEAFGAVIIAVATRREDRLFLEVGRVVRGASDGTDLERRRLAVVVVDAAPGSVERYRGAVPAGAAAAAGGGGGGSGRWAAGRGARAEVAGEGFQPWVAHRSVVSWPFGRDAPRQ